MPSPEPEPASEPEKTTEPAKPEVDLDQFAPTLEQVLALEQDARFSEAFRLCQKMKSTFREHPDVLSLDEIITRLRQRRKTASDLPFAFKSLGQGNSAAAGYAKQRFAEAGETGRLLLRKTLRDDSDETARRAAAVLIELKDEPSLSLIFERFEDLALPENQQPIRAAAVAALELPDAGHLPRVIELVGECPELMSDERVAAAMVGAADQFTKEQLSQFYRTVHADSDFSHRELMPLLKVIYYDVCAGDREEFGSLVGDPKAMEALADYIGRAYQSDDDALVTWAKESADPFSPLTVGLSVSYFEGPNFGNLIKEDITTVLNIGDGKFPLAPYTGDSFSARWTGHISIEKAGRYTFSTSSDDGSRMWVNGEKLFDGMPSKEGAGTIELAAGLHSLKIEYCDTGGNEHFTAFWSGPDIDKQVIPEDVLVTRLVPKPQKETPGDNPP